MGFRRGDIAPVIRLRPDARELRTTLRTIRRRLYQADEGILTARQSLNAIAHEVEKALGEGPR